MTVRAGKWMVALSILFALSAVAFLGCNFYDSHRAGERSTDIVGNWDGMEATNVDGEDVFEIDGDAYIGILEIPAIGIKLPVNKEWSLFNAKTAPCRYTGSIATSDLIIAAHNFDTHFGNIRTLETGDAVIFTDVSGITYRYEVSGTETLEGTDVEKMQEGEWDLTLFTCTIGGKQRVTVRCRYADTGYDLT